MKTKNIVRNLIIIAGVLVIFALVKDVRAFNFYNTDVHSHYCYTSPTTNYKEICMATPAENTFSAIQTQDGLLALRNPVKNYIITMPSGYTYDWWILGWDNSPYTGISTSSAFTTIPLANPFTKSANFQATLNSTQASRYSSIQYAEATDFGSLYTGTPDFVTGQNITPLKNKDYIFQLGYYTSSITASNFSYSILSGFRLSESSSLSVPTFQPAAWSLGFVRTFKLIKKPLASTVDIMANGSNGPITIAYNSAATLSWTSANASACTASGAWTGTKATSGSQSTGLLTSGPKTYTITCGSASDSVVVNVAAPPCVASTETRTLACPSGQVGSIVQRRTSTCPGPVWSAWVTISNTCADFNCSLDSAITSCAGSTQTNILRWSKNANPSRFIVQALTGSSWENIATLVGSASSYNDIKQPTLTQKYRVIATTSSGAQIVCVEEKEVQSARCLVDINAVECGKPPTDRILKGLFMSPMIDFQKQ